MASILDLVKHYQHSIEKYQHDEKKVLKCIDKLYHLGVTVQHLQETGVGRTVNALRKEPGDVGTAAKALVNKWKLMVASEETSEPEDHTHDTTNYNGHGNGKDSDDNVKQSRDGRDKSDDKSSRSKETEHTHKNGDHSGSKRKHHSSEESEPEKKKTRHSHPSKTDDSDKSGVRMKEEAHSDSNDSQSDSESDSESSTSSEDDSKIKQKIKTEPTDEHRTNSSKHSPHHHKEIKKEPKDTSRNSHSESSQSSAKNHSNESRHAQGKSSSKDRSSSSHKSSSSKDTESSDKKNKSDKEKSSSTKHNSSSTEKNKNNSHKHSSSEKHKSHTDKQDGKSDKYRSSSHSHKSDKEKVKSSSDKETKEKSKTKETSSSSKHKHSSDKEKSHSNSSKEKSSHSSSSSKNDKKHSSSSDVSKSKSKASEISDKESTHRKSSSSSHKSKSSSSIAKEDVPKKKPQTNSEDSEEDGIDCGTGASFAEALGMISPTKAKKKSVVKKTSSPINSFSDFGAASLLAPTARLAPLPPLEISALPEISPHYKPRPPPKLLPHFTEEEAMSQVISSKNQRTKVYSGNKMYGKVPSLYELCVNVLQEHIDALEYTGGVPYEILKPVVDKATPQQLFLLEHYNPYLMEDTDHLWQKFCAMRFRNKQRQELETWREMFIRCEEEQEHKLKSLTANIKMTQEAKKAPIKQTKMAYVDSVVKPPRNIARKQALHGTARSASASPAARVASLAAAPGIVRAGTVRPPHAAPVPVSSFNKPKKAPLMQKALQFMRGRKR